MDSKTSSTERARDGRAEGGDTDIEQLFETAPFLLVRIGFDGYLKRVNPAWAVLGWTEEELLGRPWATFLIHPDDLEQTKGAVGVMISGTEVVEFEQRLMCKDGTWRWFSCSGRPRPEEKAFYGIGIDITERRRAEDEVRRLNGELKSRAVMLEAANKELEAFTYSVSHDLRSPLRAIDGFSQILLTKHAHQLDDQGKDHLAFVIRGAKKMEQLIDDLLAFARLRQQSVRRQTVDAVAVVRDALVDLRPLQQDRRVEVHVADLPSCEADPVLLKQIWINLLSNALKFTRSRDPATIEVGAQIEEGGSAGPVYFVKDNGVGFEMRYAERIFGVFQRLHRDEEFEGTGVGLAIVDRIVRAHGGRVWTHAEPDKGATFYFTVGGGGPP